MSVRQRAGLELDGVAITHPARVIATSAGMTKGDLARYYDGVAAAMLPAIARRPLSLLRCPSGIETPCFYQRNPHGSLGAHVHPFPFRYKGKRYEYLYIDDATGLLELVQMGAIEIHPWGASIDAIDRPDRAIVDLDPGPRVPFDAVKLAARDLRQRLRRDGYDPRVKCTGGKGLHVTVPLPARDSWAQVKEFAGTIANTMVADEPTIYVATMTKAKRVGKIFIDYFRNDYTATAIADYAVRARSGLPVALPLAWRELGMLRSGNQFHIADVLARVRRRGRRTQNVLDHVGRGRVRS